MMLQDKGELANTREKLRVLEASYEHARLDRSGDEELREAEMDSLLRFIKQLEAGRTAARWRELPEWALRTLCWRCGLVMGTRARVVGDGVRGEGYGRRLRLG